jgi:L,D-peptidoglycan transpeptidase YkuD (ErfK/YbiS/YcfS/YnhG family)
MHILIKNNYLFFNNYRIKCSVGKRGIGKKKREGDLITPIGIFKIKFILFRKDRIKKLVTKAKKITIKKNMGWCDDPKSSKYNKLIKIPFYGSYEKLFIRKNIYDIIVILNYNMNPILKKRGSAIFIHIATKNYRSTQGCVALNKRNLIKVLRNIKQTTKVRII